MLATSEGSAKVQGGAPFIAVCSQVDPYLEVEFTPVQTPMSTAHAVFEAELQSTVNAIRLSLRWFPTGELDHPSLIFPMEYQPNQP
jgi:hypothetical protein